MPDFIASDVLIYLVLGLVSGISSVLWYFFKRLNSRLDVINDLLISDKDFIRSMELRLMARIDMVDSNYDKINRDVAAISAEVSLLKGRMEGIHNFDMFMNENKTN